jgi:hypothetical protein
VETGAAGDARARAAWFLQLGSAIHGRTDVAGLVYHDSGPGENAGTSWSVTADQQGQTAVTHVFTALAAGNLP